MSEDNPLTTQAPDPVTALLMRAATDPGFDSEKFKTAVEFMKEREATAARRQFNAAMAAAQAEMRAAPLDRANDYLKSRYATLNGMLQTVLPVASRHGLSIRFGSTTPTQPGWIGVTCIISLGDHEDTTPLEAPVITTGSQGGRTQMTAVQAVGSTITYLKRYALGMAFALVLADEQDDDGEATRRPTAGRYGTPQLAARQPTAPTPPRETAAPGAQARETAAQFLDKLALELANAEPAEIDTILARPRVQAARQHLTNGALDRYEHIIGQAIERANSLEQDPFAAEEQPPEHDEQPALDEHTAR